MKNMKQLNLVVILVLLIGSLFSLEENTFVTIEDIWSPLGFNEDATVLYGTGYDFTGACKWSEDTGFEIIHESILPQTYTSAGHIVGEIDTYASYINPDGTIVQIGNFENGLTEGQYVSTAYATNADGSVFAGMGWMNAMCTNAFSWTQDGGFVNLSPSDNSSSRVNTMNSEGTIFYGWITNDFGARVPTKWSNGEESYLVTYMDSNDGEVLRTSQDGQYLCGVSAGMGAVWNSEEEGIFSGSAEPGWMTVYNSISNTGVAVGVERNFFQMTQNGIIWSEDFGKLTIPEFLTMYGVAIPDGYNIDYANSISADGSLITGSAYDPEFNHVTWYVKLGQLSSISGSVALNGTVGNVEDVVISTGTLSTNPDADGNFTISLPEGTYNLTASLAGYDPQSIEDIIVEIGNDVTGINFTLNQFETIATISGTVELISWEGTITNVAISTGSYTAYPNSMGQYELIVPAGSYEITATLDGHYPVTIAEQEYNDGETYNHDFTIYSEMTQVGIQGQVTDPEIADQVFVNGKIQAGENLSSIWEDGQFSAYLNFGNYDLICYVPGYKMQSQNIDVAMEDYQDGLNVSFDLAKNAYQPKNLSSAGNSISWEAPFAPTAISENFDNFDVDSHIGSIHPLWTPVYQSNGSEVDPIIVENPLALDDNAMLISGSNDVVLRLFDLMEGSHGVDFDIMVPTGKAAHFDLLHSLYNITMGIEVFFRENGTMEVLIAGQQHDFTYNHDEYYHISNRIDLDNNQAQFIVNGEELLSYDWNIDSFTGNLVEWAPLGFLNLSADPRPESGETAEFYIDNVDYYNMNDFSTEAVYNIYLTDLDLLVAENVDLTEYTFDGLTAGMTYVAGVEAVYPDGLSSMETVTFTYNPVSNDSNDVSMVTSLNGNYPNPFNPETTIAFTTKQNGPVSIEIFNIKGQKVKTLIKDEMQAGNHSVVWNGRNDNNKQVASGVFFYRMQSGDFTKTKKMILMK